MEKQSRSKLPYSNAFFRQERSDNLHVLQTTSDERFRYDKTIHHVISELMWPRIVIVRLRNVLASFMPLIHLAHNETSNRVLDDCSVVLIPIGWVLHGTRLVLNITQLLYVMVNGVDHANQSAAFQKKIDAELRRTRTELGSDLIWVLSCLTPATCTLTALYLLIDIAWILFRAQTEINALNNMRNETTSSVRRAEIKNQIIRKQKKCALSLVNTASLGVLFLVKNFLLASILPGLAANPVLLFGLALAILVVTLISHVTGKMMERQFTANTDLINGLKLTNASPSATLSYA